MSTTEEYQAALSGAALFDCSDAGKIEVRGPEAPDFLHNLSTNDVKGLPLGGGCEAFFCNVRARALFLTRIYHLRLGGHDALWVDVSPGQGESLMQHLDRHLIAENVELADRTAAFAQLHLAGPTATDILSRTLGEQLPALDLYQHMERTFGENAVAHVRRNDTLGLPGFDVVCLSSRADEVRDRLIASGAVFAGSTVWDWLRIEAGTPAPGIDFDDNRFVLEIGRTDAVCYTKGCYIGQEPIVMARDRSGFINRNFRGFRLSSSEGIAPGAKLFANEEVGVITSSCTTPGLGPIALGYVRRGNEVPGKTLRVGVEGPTATVSLLPLRN